MTRPVATAVFLVVSVLILGVSPLVVSAQSGREVEIQSDTLEIRSNEQLAMFNGNVRFVYRQVEFLCDQMTIQYDKKGAIVSLIAEGNVTVTQQGARAVARSAEMNVRSGEVSLRGNPTLTKDGSTLSGTVIQMNIRTGKVRVANATGMFILPEDSIQ